MNICSTDSREYFHAASLTHMTLRVLYFRVSLVKFYFTGINKQVPDLFVAFYLKQQTRQTHTPPRLKDSTFQPHHTTERSRNPHRAASICANSHGAETYKKPTRWPVIRDTSCCPVHSTSSCIQDSTQSSLCSKKIPPASKPNPHPPIKTKCLRYSGSGPSSHQLRLGPPTRCYSCC